MQPTRPLRSTWSHSTSTSAEQLVCRYVPDASAAGQQFVLVKREVLVRIQSQENIMVVLLGQEKRPSVLGCKYQGFVLFADVRRCRRRVISNATRPTGTPQPTIGGRSTAYHGSRMFVGMARVRTFVDRSSRLLGWCKQCDEA